MQDGTSRVKHPTGMQVLIVHRNVHNQNRESRRCQPVDTITSKNHIKAMWLLAAGPAILIIRLSGDISNFAPNGFVNSDLIGNK